MGPTATEARPVLTATGPACGRRVRRAWRSRLGAIGFALLTVWVLFSLTLVWLQFGGFDPDDGRLPSAEHPLFYPVLMLHIVTATTALVTGVLQVWPWLRRRHPRVHRRSGRLYVVAGVWPAAATALVLTSVWTFTPLTAVNDVITSTIWLGTTTYGFVLARRRRYAEHRRWMLRSFAVTASVLLGQAVAVPTAMLLRPVLVSHFGGDEHIYLQVWSATNLWVRLLLALVVVELWLERDVARRRRVPAVNGSGDSPVTGPAPEDGPASEVPAVEPRERP